MKKLVSFLPVVVLATVLLTAVTCGRKEDPTLDDTLTVSPESISFGAEDSSTKFVYITTESDWTASTSASWIRLTERTSGTGKGTLSVQADANTGENRTGSITVKGSKTVTVSVTQKGKNIEVLVPIADAFDGVKRSSTTYQLLVYSFADSDGDGVGDFKGIQNRLEYLDGLGVTALWLSPVHPADSYHGYDVKDYYKVNPDYGTEEDFKALVDAAHAKGIKIYLDYVLNHSGKGNAWFTEALADPSSPYRDYYFFSTNPSADYKNFPMLSGTRYVSGEWKTAVSGSPKLTITKTSEAVTSGNSEWNLWFWQGSAEGKPVRFTDKGDGTLYLVMDINGSCGMLLRKYMNWDAGSKFGAKGNGTLKEGTPLELVAEGGDISFTGSGRYRIEISNVSTETLYYMGAFSDWMPDLNYGAIADCENNACFQDLAASADKWINMGVDGFRLDAVKHICGGIDSYNNSANRNFLKKWYDRCNAAYKAAGHSDNIFMVGEAWDGHNVEQYYYEGITSCFEFGYWPLLYRALTSGDASSYVSTVAGFLKDHKAIRADAETSLFLTNHDHSSQTGGGEVRAADDLGKDPAKEKQAAAMLLTTPGKPFVYQGEELGYWGNSKDRGDEYLRAPIVWDAAAKEIAKAGVNNKVDNTMLKGSISVETQSADPGSLLNVYKTFSRVRNTYPALADGTMTDAALGGGNSITAWYLTSSDGQKMLVIHNVAASEKSVAVSFDISKPVAILGTVSQDQDNLVLAGNSSVVFKL